MKRAEVLVAPTEQEKNGSAGPSRTGSSGGNGTTTMANGTVTSTNLPRPATGAISNSRQAQSHQPHQLPNSSSSSENKNMNENKNTPLDVDMISSDSDLFSPELDSDGEDADIEDAMEMFFNSGHEEFLTDLGLDKNGKEMIKPRPRLAMSLFGDDSDDDDDLPIASRNGKRNNGPGGQKQLTNSNQGNNINMMVERGAASTSSRTVVDGKLPFAAAGAKRRQVFNFVHFQQAISPQEQTFLRMMEVLHDTVLEEEEQINASGACTGAQENEKPEGDVDAKAKMGDNIKDQQQQKEKNDVEKRDQTRQAAGAVEGHATTSSGLNRSAETGRNASKKSSKMHLALTPDVDEVLAPASKVNSKDGPTTSTSGVSTSDANDGKPADEASIIASSKNTTKNTTSPSSAPFAKSIRVAVDVIRTQIVDVGEMTKFLVCIKESPLMQEHTEELLLEVAECYMHKIALDDVNKQRKPCMLKCEGKEFGAVLGRVFFQDLCLPHLLRPAPRRRTLAWKFLVVISRLVGFWTSSDEHRSR
ncbi:unnamed protein product, partial [Amoebophrya sp. A25]|eukprot:GSA25T00004092001.1